jgi:phage repressor protein C with HTH and peptisase S24 domain
MTAMGDRIRKARQAQKLTQQGLAQRLGIARVSVTNWERGQTVPDTKRIPEIASILGVSPDWILLEESQSPPANATPIDLPPRGDGAQVPVYGHAVGGIQGEFELNGNLLFTIDAPPGYSIIKGCYAVQVSGDSMSPRYEDGEIVMVDPSQRVRKGDYVVAQIHQNENDPPLAFVKRFVKHNAVELVLESLNPPVPSDEPLRWNAGTVQSVHKIVFSSVG